MQSRTEVIDGMKQSAEKIVNQCKEVFSTPVCDNYVNKELLSVLNIISNNIMVAIEVLIDIRDNTIEDPTKCIKPNK